MDRGTVVEGILILDADTRHPWVFHGIEGYAAPAPMPGGTTAMARGRCCPADIVAQYA